MNSRNGLWSALAAAVALAVLAGTARAGTYWCVGAGGGHVSLNNASSWSTFQTNSTSHPGVVPGPSDTVVFNVNGQTVTSYDDMDADQSYSGMVYRASVAYQYLEPTAGGTPFHNLTIGSGGIMVFPGSGAFWDNQGKQALGITLGADQTWMIKSGTVLLQGVPVNGGGHSLTLVRGPVQVGINSTTAYANSAAFTNLSSMTFAEGGDFTIVNSTKNGGISVDRIGDATEIMSYGGTLSYAYSSAPISGVFTETVHAAHLIKGDFTHAQDGGPYAYYTNVFYYAGGLDHTGTAATIIFTVTSSASSQHWPVFGATVYNDRVVIPGQSTTSFLGPWSIVQFQGFAAYDTTSYLSCPRGVYGNAGSSIAANTSDQNGIYNVGSALVTASADIQVGALVMNRSTATQLALAGHKLTIASGGLDLDYPSQSDSISNGTVTAGTGSNTNLYVFVPSTAANGVKNIDAVIADNGAGKVSLVKSGPNVLTLTQANTYSGNTTINDGTIYLSTAGSIVNSANIELLWGSFNSGARLDVSAQTSTWALGAGQTLLGNGTVIGNVNVNGTVAPGANTNLAGVTGTGMLTVTGNVAFANNATLRVNVQNAVNAGDAWGDANTWGAGYGRLKVNGNVNLGANAILDVERVGTPTINNGDKLFIIDNSGANPVSGQFKTPSGRVLNDGDVFTAAGTNFQIRYTGNLPSFATNGGYSVVIQVTSQAATGIGKGTLLVFR